MSSSNSYNKNVENNDKTVKHGQPHSPEMQNPFAALMEQCTALLGCGVPSDFVPATTKKALIVYQFDQHVLQFNANTLIQDKLSAYPVRGEHDNIQTGAVQWIDG